jgi:hypothetical protein
MSDYTDYIAEHIDKTIAYTEYLAENINSNIAYTEYMRGPKGVIGEQGITGASGISGVSGVSGSQGCSGTHGYSTSSGRGIDIAEQLNWITDYANAHQTKKELPKMLEDFKIIKNNITSNNWEDEYFPSFRMLNE